MAKKIAVEKLITTVASVISDKSVQKVILGEYSDGSPRSLMDSIHGEILSPKQRNTSTKKKKKKGKKKKKNKIKL